MDLTGIFYVQKPLLVWAEYTVMWKIPANETFYFKLHTGLKEFVFYLPTFH